jgi:hypothetical protein
MSRTPLKAGRGMLAKYGPVPSAEEIDENRPATSSTSPPLREGKSSSHPSVWRKSRLFRRRGGLYRNLLCATSKGTFFNRHIRGHFPHARLSAEN